LTSFELTDPTLSHPRERGLDAVDHGELCVTLRKLFFRREDFGCVRFWNGLFEVCFAMALLQTFPSLLKSWSPNP